MRAMYQIIFILALLVFSVLSQSQTRAIDLERLWSHILQNRNYELSGGITIEEKLYFNSADKNSPEYQQKKRETLRRFLYTYESDLKANVADRGYAHHQIMNALKDEGMDISLKSLQQAKLNVEKMIPRSASSVVQEARAKLTGRAFKTFALADVALWAAMGYAEMRDQEILKSIENRECPANPSERHVRTVMLQSLEVQKQIYANCDPSKSVIPSSLQAKIRQSRQDSREHLSVRKPSCTFDEKGLGRIESLTDMGTKQILYFDSSDQIHKVQIFPQDIKYNGSYLEYFPGENDGTVRYSGIRSPNPEAVTPVFERAQFEKESLISFASRIQCTLEPCESDIDGPFAHVQVAELPPGVTPQKPFGEIQPNAEFFLQAAKTLGHFRMGIEQNTESTMNFKNVCILLGAIPPKKEKTAEGKKINIPEKATPIIR